MCGFTGRTEKGQVGSCSWESVREWDAQLCSMSRQHRRSEMRRAGRPYVRGATDTCGAGLTFRFQLDTIVLGTCSPAGRTGC